ncbi:MAG TPA: hypothetical protein VLO29_10410 [Salegentibacter sp.]|nr:hypothetical protein [Salegentibacter sp.]
MATSFKNRFSDGDQSSEELQSETDGWLHEIFNATEHIRFLRKFLVADIFSDSQLNMFEMFEEFKKRLETYRMESINLNQEVHNHRFDLEGMRECDDISCESFYREQHYQLKIKFTDFITGLKDLQSQIFNYTGDLLITKKK